MRAAGALLLALALLSGCALRPLYGSGSSAATSTLNQIAVAPIEGKAGWLMRGALLERMGREPASPRLRLDIRLDDSIQGFGVRGDDTITRERRTLRARYQLVDVASGAVLLDATAGSDAGIDVVSSDYATIVAENSALENLTRRLADQIILRLATVPPPPS